MSIFWITSAFSNIFKWKTKARKKIYFSSNKQIYKTSWFLNDIEKVWVKKKRKFKKLTF